MLTFDNCSTSFTTDSLLAVLALVPQLQQLSVHTDFDNTNVGCTPALPNSIGPTTELALEKFSTNVKLTDINIERIQLACPALFELGLYDLPVIACTRVHIQRLRLCHHNNVKDGNIGKLFGLQQLVLENCAHLSDVGLRVLARNNQQLRCLTLKNIGTGSKSAFVTYRGLLEFLDHCPLLTSVTYLMKRMNSVNSKAFEADACFAILCRRLYRNLKHFECNIV